MRPSANPFIVSGYHSPEHFCDRAQELAWMMEQFDNERNTVLYSWRRMGKTSLIRHFFYHLNKNKKADAVFVDLLGTSTLGEANKRIATAIVHQLNDTSKGIGAGLLKFIGSIGATFGVDPLSGTPQVTFGLVPVQSVPSSLEAMGKYLEARKKPVTICIDEFQQVVNYQEEHAEATFRTWMQEFPMVRFVFSGSHRQMMESMFSEASRPFYRSAQMLKLEALPVAEYSDFISVRFRNTGKVIDTAFIDRIFEWTRRQTYYVQLICNKLYGRSNVVDQKVLDEVLAEIIYQEVPIFSTYQQLLTAFQWKLLIAIAKSEEVENPLSQEFLGKYGFGAASSVSSALQALTRKEFVIVNDGRHTLHDTLLMRWLQNL
ncbi:MAG: ATP-binding protein [Imperialibacter sp.]|uniref:AAA family ATPase n=1 Tax=Imperialibacter sp. TaxID=2038411 RepID=UPI0032EB9F5F